MLSKLTSSLFTGGYAALIRGKACQKADGRLDETLCTTIFDTCEQIQTKKLFFFARSVNISHFLLFASVVVAKIVSWLVGRKKSEGSNKQKCNLVPI